MEIALAAPLGPLRVEEHVQECARRAKTGNNLAFVRLLPPGTPVCWRFPATPAATPVRAPPYFFLVRPARRLPPNHPRVPNPPSFQQLVEEHYVMLYHFALSLARQEAEAADLVQQTFLTWALKGHQLRDPGQARPWLFTTLHREFLRGRKREEALARTLLSEEVASVPEVPPDALRETDAALVQEAMAGLSDHHRVALSLFYLGGHTYGEMSEILGVPIGTIMSRLSRAKAELRRAIGSVSKRTDRKGDVDGPR